MSALALNLRATWGRAYGRLVGAFREPTWLLTDAKSQVVFRHEDGQPVAIEAVALSSQCTDEVDTERLCPAVSSKIVDTVIPKALRPATAGRVRH